MYNWTVYQLSDPRNPDQPRYVGVTHKDPHKRLLRHVSDAKYKRKYEFGTKR